ncbi:DUF1523 family protein [Alphaproteobacteria bacterium GH1-50]|uniref:DUF1523 family protein n=1 Tax=Kangsaoukella pontilimi TaxID=2691042 RepID=A0A7C9N1Q0_9RHOB|nr:DUF1523 family protein [Kangsaoukella pontilimi]MXQ08858.1 DUF1523 family protein [Kangsaoukella pontilimi]
MKYIAWTARIIVFLVIAGVFHYNLPDRDIVRIVNTEVRRVDFGSNSTFWQNSGAGDAVSNVNRDVFFIETIQPDGSPLVFRNEDTGWGWPPYFKFDTADLQTQARNLVSTETAPTWVAVRHYGWRAQIFSIFPNATSIEPVPGPDTRLIPWFNIIFLTIVLIISATIWRLWRNFRQARIDPVIEDIEEDVDIARDRVGGFFSRLFGRK